MADAGQRKSSRKHEMHTYYKFRCAYQQHKHRFLFLGRDDSKQRIAISSAAFAPLLLHASPSFLADQRHRISDTCGGEHKKGSRGGEGVERRFSRCRRWSITRNQRQRRRCSWWERRPQCFMQQLWSPCRHHFSCLRYWRCHCEFHVDFFLSLQQRESYSRLHECKREEKDLLYYHYYSFFYISL
ncbi:unnamed protein product [Musa hybrid cultivar]